MPRIHNIINIILGIVVIALTAAIIADVIILRFDREPPLETIEENTSATMTSRRQDLEFYAPILDKGLFGSASRGALSLITPPASSSSRAAPLAASSELLLLGTSTGSFRESFALVKNAVSQEERVFRLGDMVFNAGRLVSVERERVFIESNGRKMELLTPLASASTEPASKGEKSAFGSSVSGSVSRVIDKRVLNAAMDNISQTMTDARMLPNQKNGRVEGFRISEIKSDGIFAKLGLKDGDILLRLNDFPVNSPDSALQSLVALKGQNSITLDLLRDDRPVTYSFDIR